MKSMAEVNDRVARLVGQWEAECPDLDLEAAATTERLLRLGPLLDEMVGEVASRHGLRRAELEVLLALCRAGSPYQLTPSQLSELLLVSSGTLTSRLDRIEHKALIERQPNPSDRRSLEVRLSDRGRAIAREAIAAIVANGSWILEPLSAAEREGLDRGLSQLTERIAAGGWRRPVA